MSVRVILGRTMYTIHGADHLGVQGDLVQIQRTTPDGPETVAVAGRDLLVTLEPAECAKVEIGDVDARTDEEEAARLPVTRPNGARWYPVGEPLD